MPFQTSEHGVTMSGVDALLLLIFLLYIEHVSSSELHYHIPEEVPVGHVIADIVAGARLAAHYPSEVVVGGELRFTLLTEPAMPVVVDESSGQLITSGRVDREAICTASGMTSSGPCRVRLDVAVHPVQYFRIVKVAVDVTDVNDNAPVFRPAAIVREISEAASAGSGFVIPTAHDADTAEFGVAKYLLTDVDGRAADADGPFGLSISRKLDGSTEVRRNNVITILMNLQSIIYSFYFTRLVAKCTQIQIHTHTQINTTHTNIQIQTYEQLMSSAITQTTQCGLRCY